MNFHRAPLYLRRMTERASGSASSSARVSSGILAKVKLVVKQILSVINVEMILYLGKSFISWSKQGERSLAGCHLRKTLTLNMIIMKRIMLIILI